MYDKKNDAIKEPLNRVKNNPLISGFFMPSWVSSLERSRVTVTVCGIATVPKGAFLCIALLFVLLKGCDPAYSSSYRFSDEDAIKAIIGEAEDQGLVGMKAIAYGIRNRGTLKGVYGLNAPRVKAHKYSRSTYLMAKSQWLESAKGYDITHGATHWENVRAFGKPYWTKEMVETFRHKDHVFYRKAARHA